MVSKKLLNDFPQIKEEGYGIAVPDLTVYFSVYSFFGFDAANGRVALPLYFYEKDTTGEYPKKVLIVSCDDWNIRGEVEIHCPDVIRKEGDMQRLPKFMFTICLQKRVKNMIFLLPLQILFSIYRI